MSKNKSTGLEKTVITARVDKTAVNILNAYAKDKNQSLSSVVNTILSGYAGIIVQGVCYWAKLKMPYDIGLPQPPDDLEIIILRELGIIESDVKKLANHNPDTKLLPPNNKPFSNLESGFINSDVKKLTNHKPD